MKFQPTKPQYILDETELKRANNTIKSMSKGVEGAEADDADEGAWAKLCVCKRYNLDAYGDTNVKEDELEILPTDYLLVTAKTTSSIRLAFPHPSTAMCTEPPRAALLFPILSCGFGEQSRDRMVIFI
ncbi:uncharacterized protein HD556DRAFT_1308721 [Suillus plorans]|uniref:Uncharacterized protein n=1 Tax=Suillus plorans TaxID=116603 RepID=A0A9P7DHS7_9AGAM|nr:uncharacterized protein HD556DRAFT_1308721 [Suillus plorans]KAG1793286.1 hypothetical protein HD556DRAFT_1308721 [Suillus plorans]